jgi:hypothetical protein
MGEFLGQLLNLRAQHKFRPGKGDFNWRKIKAIFLLVILYFGWLWPLTYGFWMETIPSPLLGVADQITTALLSVLPIFITFGIITYFKGKKFS